MVRVAVVVPAALEAVTVYVSVAAALVGVPLMTPVAGPIRGIALVLKCRPAGRAGLTLYDVGAPPVLVGTFSWISTSAV